MYSATIKFHQGINISDLNKGSFIPVNLSMLLCGRITVIETKWQLPLFRERERGGGTYSAASGNVMPLKEEDRYSVYISIAVPLM